MLSPIIPGQISIKVYCITILSCLFSADDFEGGDRILSFSPSVSTLCVPIGILSDNLVEGEEFFNVSLLLQANQTFAELGSSMATVTIIDSDGGIYKCQVS